VAKPDEEATRHRPSSPERTIFNDLDRLDLDVGVQVLMPSAVMDEEAPSKVCICESGFDFETTSDKTICVAKEALMEDGRKCYKAPCTSGKSRVGDDSVFELGFDLDDKSDIKDRNNKPRDFTKEASLNDGRKGYKAPHTFGRGRVGDDSVFEFGFDFKDKIDTPSGIAKEASLNDVRKGYKAPRTSGKSRVGDDSVVIDKIIKRSDVADESSSSNGCRSYRSPLALGKLGGH